MTPLPNRTAVYATGIIALLLGLLPLIGNLDWTSTAGIVAALTAILGVVYKWLDNWGKWERGEGAGIFPGEPEDEFDELHAEPVPAKMTIDPDVEEHTEPTPPTPRRQGSRRS
jgi:hypothetical protein